MRAIVTTKGQVTIPKHVRDLAHISAGTQLDFSIRQGEIVVTPIRTSFSALKGIVKKKPRKPVSVGDMRRAIRQRAGRAVQ